MLPPKLLDLRQTLQERQSNGVLSDHENGLLSELDDIHQIEPDTMQNIAFPGPKSGRIGSVAPTAQVCPCCGRPF